MLFNFWKILEIEPTTDVRAIKQAYAALAKKYHPEQYPEEFLNLRNAYEAAMDYASKGTELFFIQDDYDDTQEIENIEEEGLEEQQYKEEGSEKSEEKIFWDLSKLSDNNDVDCTAALSQFLDLYKSKNNKDANKWYTYFTSYDFLEVWREEKFTRLMLKAVYENVEEFPVNKTFAKCLNSVYGCFVYNSYEFDVVQYSKNAFFDGFSNIEKILELCGNIGKMTQNDLSMFISFCEYRILVSFAEENQWSDTIKINTEYILNRYVMAYLRDRYEKKGYSDVDRYYLGIRLITNFIKKYDLPDDIYQYIWKNYSLESAVNGRNKIYYGEIREFILNKNIIHYSQTKDDNKNIDINKSTKINLVEDNKKVYNMYYDYQKSLTKDQLDIRLIEDFFAQPETEKLLKDRHFIYDTLYYWIAMPHHLIFLKKLYDFYSKNTDVFKAKEILTKIKKREKEVSAENALKEDKQNKNYSMCNIEHRPFLRYWLNIGFYRAVNFSDVLKENLLFSEKWANAFGDKKHKLSLIVYRNKIVEIEFHRRYAEYFYGGEAIYKPFLQWYALEKIEDDTLFFLLLPAVIPFIDDEETYNTVLSIINNHFKNTPLTEENKNQLSKGIIKILFCGRYILEEIDDYDDEFHYDCNEYEIYGENETNLYVCTWSKYSHLLCFYEQKIYERVFMPKGVYDNILSEAEAISLAKDLLLSQCSKTVVNISYLRIMPIYLYVQPNSAKAEKSVGEEITEDVLISALDRFAENKVRRVEIKWLQEEVVLINTGDNCACFYFNDTKYTTCKLLSMPEVYYTVDSKYIIHVPFLFGKLPNYDIFNSPKQLVMNLCPLLFQFGEGIVPVNRVNGKYVWSQNVYLYGKYDAYLLDKMKLGDFKPEEIITDHNIKRKIIIHKFPDFIEVISRNSEKQKIAIKPNTKDQLQMYLQMYLQSSIKYLHLCWEFKESDDIFSAHMFLLQEEKKYALYYLDDKSKSAYCLIGSLDEYLKPEGQSLIVDICSVPMHLYSIHKDVIRLRFFLSLLLDSIENPETVLNKVGEFTDGTKLYKHNMTYEELYNKLIEVC